MVGSPVDPGSPSTTHAERRSSRSASASSAGTAPRAPRLRVDATTLVAAPLLVWALAERYFPRLAPRLSEGTYWGMAAAGVAALGLSVLAHEVAHAIVARRHGVATRAIAFRLAGGRAELERALPTPASEATMAVAGPVANLLVAVATIAALGAREWGVPVAGVLAFAARANLLLALVNALPVFPLDGGRVVRALLWARGAPIAEATRRAVRVGRITALAIAAAGVVMAAMGQWTPGIVALAAASYLYRRAARATPTSASRAS